MDDLRALRVAAADHTLFAPGDLHNAIDRIGFVQADPIRAPARAQDLILRQRVTGYRAGDLERAYDTLPLVEDMVHVYGFLHRRDRPLLHPRRLARTFAVEDEHPHLRRLVLRHLAAQGPSDARAVEQGLEVRHRRGSMVNAWGGQSSAVGRMLEVLHYRGVLEVARRVRGIRIYALCPVDPALRLSPQRRADGLIALLVRLYAPLPTATLTQLTLMLGERAIARDALRARIPLLLRRGVLRSTRVDGVDYLQPAGDAVEGADLSADRSARTHVEEREPSVHFLAPFDPLVWDRRRFESLWGWPYRFEAYVPPAKRRLGYYALPLLWRTDDDAQVIGWINAKRVAAGTLSIEAGYARRRPTGSVFRRAFEAEVARLQAFLGRDEPVDDRLIGPTFGTGRLEATLE